MFDPLEKPIGLAGNPPEIVSPRERIEYVKRFETGEYNDLALIANADPDVGELYWFINDSFIGRADPKTPVWWNLVPGRHVISVVDDYGRSVSRDISVVMRQ